MNRHSDPARWPSPRQFIHRASGQDEGGARARAKLERLTACLNLVFDRSPQYVMDKIVEMFVLRNDKGRD
jgi:hypothetical protein